MGRYLLGVDAGNTVVKAGLFDRSGREVAHAAQQGDVSRPHPRWAERDMEAAWAATGSVIAACVDRAGVAAGEIAAVCVAGHSDGLYPVDAALRPVRPAVLATDSRAHDVWDRWRAAGVLKDALTLTGTEPAAASPAALCAWFEIGR